ncbi:carbon-nitrogen hydrolase family protein [Phaeovulum sp. W22_SRMD_FR3]|uniref:carbon-nitrogen hydrolase family protein n=1 Tax=Phaeovulum sp. W22_SRMD_FR3 TaxID=3240274 RepID=UPI003F9DC7CE
MKLALSQALPVDGRIDAAFDRIEQALTAAAAAGARLLVVPELFLPGYNRPDLHATLAQPRDGEWLQRLQAMTQNIGCGLVFGWAERADGKVYNVASALGPDGRFLAHYRKIQLFGAMERESFARGTEAPPVFDLDGRRFGLLICYDVEFPGHVAALAARGAEILLVPTANPLGYEHVQRALIPARAHESRLIIAYANYTGSEAGLTFGGRSLIVGPDAEPLAQAGLAEALMIVDLPPLGAWPDTAHSAQAAEYLPTR